MSKQSDPHEWLRFAHDDLAAARLLLTDVELPPRMACFHAQQAAEKAPERPSEKVDALACRSDALVAADAALSSPGVGRLRSEATKHTTANEGPARPAIQLGDEFARWARRPGGRCGQ